jgi:succinoglycan biosynthesis transport protein ExoP
VEIMVFASPKNAIYTIEARSSNPAFTTLYLKALMERYLEYRRDIRARVSSDTLASIADQMEKLERELKASQMKLEDYEKTNNFAVLQEESTVEAGYLAKLKTELSDLQLQLKLLDDTAQSLAVTQPGATNSADSMLENLRATDAGSAAGRLDAARQIELLKAERAKLSLRLRPQHPKIIKLDEDIARSQKLLDVFSRQNQEQINALRDTLQLKINNVQTFIKDWEGKLSVSSALLAEASGLKTKIAHKQAIYDQLVAMRQNMDISRNIGQETLEILDPASSAKRSYKEAWMMLTQAGFIGLALGCAIIFLITLRDDRFNSMVEVTESFGDNVVGQVPEMPELATPGSTPLALLYLAVDGKRPRVLLVTSAVPNEGKSTVATNLARAMALGGSKVLLVDADLRKGHIHEKLALKSKPGLSELLRQSAAAGQLADLQDFLQPTDLDDFLFLSRGKICHSPGDLFLNPVFDQFLEQARTKFDYVIIDSSPVFAADDSSTLAPKVEGTLFVVRNQFSNARAVREALNLLFQRQARVLGLILNRADSKDRSYYAYKYADYYAKSNAEADEKD